MNHRIASTLGYLGSVAAATLAATLMSGNAMAQTELYDNRAPVVSALTRAEVKAALAADRSEVTSYASDWRMQQDTKPDGNSGYTRAQARAEYIAAREDVLVMNAEHGGAGYFGRMPRRAPSSTMVAGQLR